MPSDGAEPHGVGRRHRVGGAGHVVRRAASEFSRVSSNLNYRVFPREFNTPSILYKRWPIRDGRQIFEIFKR